MLGRCLAHDVLKRFVYLVKGVGRGGRQGVDSSPVVSIWIAYVTEGRARVDGKEENERERLCPIIPSFPSERKLLTY